MTASHSPLRVLKAQADAIAANLKCIERGEKVTADLGNKLADARTRSTVTFGVVMDDKIVKIEMTWEIVRSTSEVALAAYVLKQMRNAQESEH